MNRHVFLLSTCCLTCMPAMAGSLSVGYSQNEQISVISDQKIDFSPDGQALMLSFDLSDDLSLSFNYSGLSDDTAVTNRVSGQLDISNWGVSTHYYRGNWSYSLGYNDWEDELSLSASAQNPRRINQDTSAQSASANVGYSWSTDTWEFALSSGLHLSDWEQRNLNSRPEQTDQSSVDSGSSTFLSVNTSISHFLEIDTNTAFILGAGVEWNQLFDSESEAVSRNGRNVSQITNIRILNAITSQSIFGTETYGQANLYLVFLFAQNWSFDVNLSTDFATEDNSSAFSATVGYTF